VVLGGVHRALLVRLVVVAAAMFGFGYLLVPIYKALCELTGINLLTRPDKAAQVQAQNTQVDTSRSIEVLFDSNERGTWGFKPETRSLWVHPGQLTTVRYDITNHQEHAAAGQAIPSYLPAKAAAHFTKVQCFCFEQQRFEPGQKRVFPVAFVLSPNLPKDVRSITLSYTFFEIPGAVAINN
jgi:cytochrome c oxidase assembly protein subunit 11